MLREARQRTSSRAFIDGVEVALCAGHARARTRIKSGESRQFATLDEWELSIRNTMSPLDEPAVPPPEAAPPQELAPAPAPEAEAEPAPEAAMGPEPVA
eukprot:3315575-Prymnesium_polylepis.1